MCINTLVALLLAFAVEARAGGVPSPGVTEPGAFRPLVTRVRPESPCTGDSITLHIDFCDPCGTFTGSERVSSNHIRVFATTYIATDSAIAMPCIQRPCPMERLSIDLGAFPVGSHQIDVELVESVLRGVYDRIADTVVTHESVTVDVSPMCGSPDVTPPNWGEIRIGEPAQCGLPAPPICAGAPIGVFLRGILANSCEGKLLSVDYIEPSYASGSIRSVPAVVRVLEDDGGCIPPRVCPDIIRDWSASVSIPGLPAGDYQLGVEHAVVTCADTFPRDSVKYVTIPFTVVDGPVRTSCLIPTWSRSWTGSGCNARSESEPVALELSMQSWVPLSTLRGRLVLRDSTRFFVKNLEPDCAASGMRLQWAQTSSGAQFAMFADHGAPIPAEPPDFVRFGGVPVLRVFLGLRDIVASATEIEAVDLLGTDSTGADVPTCTPPPCVEYRPIGNIYWQGLTCDANRDGTADVRDLVRMAHCVLGTGACPESLSAFDCNHDGRTTIDDLLCCAGPILRGHLPDSAATRDEPEVKVRLRGINPTPDGVDLRVMVYGDDRLGAARLAVTFPIDRFAGAGVEVVGSSTNWLALSQEEGGQLIIGLVNVGGSSPTGGPSALNLDLHFTLAYGHSPGGDVSLVGAEFSGPDGVGLRADAGPQWQPLGGEIGLSPPRPNPFGAQARFTLRLPERGLVELAVHDVAGRRVATLFRGGLSTDPTPFTWNGRDDHGTAVHDGVYFVRCTVYGRTQFQRVILLRGN